MLNITYTAPIVQTRDAYYLENLYEKLQDEYDILMSIKEEILEMTNEWFAENDLDTHIIITDLQKEILDSVISPIKSMEETALNNINKTLEKIKLTD